MNKDKTVVYTGEVIIPANFLTEESKESVGEDAPPKRIEYQLHGQGKLEAKFYKSNFSTYTGKIENNKRQGYAHLVMTKMVDDEKVKVEFEGHFDNDQPNGQGTLTLNTQHEDLNESITSDPFGLIAKHKA